MQGAKKNESGVNKLLIRDLKFCSNAAVWIFRGYLKNIFLSIAIILIAFSGCKTGSNENNNQEYIKTIETYRAERLEKLKSPTGWLNLAGLFWLKEGENTIGGDTSNTIVFPEKAKPHLGKILLNNKGVIFFPGKDTDIKINNEILNQKTLKTDANGKPDVVKHGDFGWYIIKRGEKFGIRLRDYNSLALKKLDSIPAYPIDLKWKVKAKFKKLQEEKTVFVPTVIGIDEEYSVTGILTFRINKKKYSLTPFESKNGFFLIFADKTNQNETYPAGRFLYTSKPDENGSVFIDFNI